MKHLLKMIIVLALLAPLSAQGISSEKVLKSWDSMTSMFVGNAEKMPSKYFEYSPIEPLSTFAELVNHTAGANYMFAKTVKLTNPKKDLSARDKKTLVKNLKESFKFIRKGMENLSDRDLKEKINWFGSEMSRLNAILTMTQHLQRESGKVITYLRLKKTAPVRSGGW